MYTQEQLFVIEDIDKLSAKDLVWRVVDREKLENIVTTIQK